MSAATAAVSPRVDLFRQRDFRLLWTGESTSALGSSVTSVALPLVALGTLHAGVIAVSLLSAAAWLPWLLIGLPAGAWVDRVRRRPVMIACDAASLALFVSVPVAVWAGVLTMAQLLTVALLTGVAEVFFATAYRAYLPALVTGAELLEGNSRLQGAESAAQVLGPGLAGVLAQLAGAANALLADAASFLVSLVCLRRIDAVEPEVVHEHRSLVADVAVGLHFVARDRLLRMLAVFGSAANLVLTGYSAIVVAFLVRGLGLSAGAAGALIATGSVGGVLGALLAPRISARVGSARALLVCKVGSTPFSLLIPLAGPGWRLGFFALGAFGFVAGVVGGNVISNGFMQAYCPSALMGRVTTSMQFVNYGAIPLGALLGGVLADSLGFHTALWLLFGSFMASSTILLASPLRGARELPTRRAEPA